MGKDHTHVLLTGPPGCGKTTVIQRCLEHLLDRRVRGFYTRELRRDGQRVGFEAVGLSGRTVPLASVKSQSKLRVGKYGVELPGFEELVRLELLQAGADVDLIVVDEIGKMECFSDLFVDAMRTTLDGHTPLLGTVAMKGGGFIAEVKQRTDVKLVTVSPDNRDALPSQIAAKFST